MNAIAAPTALTCTHHELVEAGAQMGEVSGWMVPLSFSGRGPEVEANAARSTVGLAEQGHLSKIRVQGPGTAAALTPLGKAPAVGTVINFTIRSESGDIEVEVARLSNDEVWITAPAGSMEAVSACIDVSSGDAAIFDLTGSYAGMRLVGPESPAVVASLTDMDMRDQFLGNGLCAQTMAAEVYALIVRTDAGTIPSYRLYFGREFGLYTYEAVMGIGLTRGMELIGQEALTALGCSP